MKIIALTAENVKRLVAVEIRPDGNMVQITGKNGSGKTSTLDSIWWALAGAKHIQSAPIRKGANQARIKLDMGEIVVTRTFKREKEGEGYTTKLEVVGNVKGSPQAMLDSLLDSLAFDPLKFARMDPPEQFDALKKYVPGVDFDKFAADNSIDMSNRKEINRKAKEARIMADQIVIPPNSPKEAIDETALVQQLADAGRHNSDIETRKLRREQVAKDAEGNDQQAARLRQEALRILEDAQHTADKLRADAEDAERAAKDKRDKLAAAEPLPAPISVDELQTKIQQAKATNSLVKQVAAKADLEKKAAEFEKQSDELTARMEKREQDKIAALAAAKLPIDSIAMGDGVVLLNGVPFDQASDAEQLKASCALAMAGNPKLRVIRVRDGSLLDETSLALLAQMAEERDYQVWIERCSNGEQIGFVIEDGELKAHETETE